MMAESQNEQIFPATLKFTKWGVFNLFASFMETVSNKLTRKNNGKAHFLKIINLVISNVINVKS